MRLIIVEDDLLLAKSLKRLLEKQYVIDIASTAEEASYLVDINEYDLAIIDIGLPDYPGTELCQKLRKNSFEQPILILTANSKPDEKVFGLENGADDYVCKPFHPEELFSRIRALLRRSSHYQPHTYEMSNYSFDATNKQLKQGSIFLQLNCKEGQLLELLLRHKGSIVTRSMIIEHVWENTEDIATNTIEVHISRLRRRMTKHFGISCIKTVKNIGYLIPNTKTN